MENIAIHDPPIPVDEPIVAKMCYSIADIELILGISRPSVVKLLKQNKFRWFKVGTTYRISKPSFEAWLQKTI